MNGLSGLNFNCRLKDGFTQIKFPESQWNLIKLVSLLQDLGSEQLSKITDKGHSQLI